MTIVNQSVKRTVQGNGAQTVFDYNFLIPSAADADLYLTDAVTGVTTLLPPSAWSLSGANSPLGGTFTYPRNAGQQPLPSTQKLTLVRTVPHTQITSLQNQSGFQPRAVESALDWIVMQIQQIADGVSRSLRLPVSTSQGVSTLLPDPAPEKLIGWNVAANGLQNFDPSVLATLVAYGTARADIFGGDGTTTQFTLTSDPGNQAVLDVSISGVTQRPGLDYTWAGGTTLTFVTAPAVGVNNILVRYFQGLPGIITEAQDVIYTPAGAGADARTAEDKMRDIVSVKDFGAVGNNTANDRLAIQEGLTAAGVFPGKAIQINRGTYLLNATAGRALFIDTPVKMYGEGSLYSSLNPAAASASDDTLYIQPNPANGDFTLSSLQDFAIHNPFTGARVGRSGVFLDTQAAGSNQAALFSLERIAIGQGSNYGFWHLNNPTNNPNGGMYCARITGSVIKGGIKLESSGDSINVTENILTGDFIGVNVSLVSGASLLQIQANNITNSGGAIRIDNGSRFRILGNNIENYLAAGAAAQNNAAVININGANGVMYGGAIQQNLISAFGASDATALLRLRNSRGISIEDNVFLNGASATTGIDIGSNCEDIRVGANTYSAAVTTKVVDAGVGTMGVVKTASLQNGWVAFLTSHATFKFIKSADGLVHCYGVIKNGTTTNGTLITTLPQRFRPSEIIRCPIQVINGGTPQLAEMTIETDGSVRINYVLANAQVQFNFSFPAANLADAVSLE